MSQQPTRTNDNAQQDIQRLAEMLWTDPEYWEQEGLPVPTEPCPKYFLNSPRPTSPKETKA